MFLTSQPYDVDAIAHIGLTWCRMTVERFVRILWRVFEKIKKMEKWLFLDIFGLISAIFLTSQSYEFVAFAHAGTAMDRMTVQNFMKIVWTVFEKFEFSLKGQGKNDPIA